MQGMVKWFDVRKGFGFIVNPEGKDVFVHYSSIEAEGFRALRDGDMVEYDEVAGAKGLHAEHVKLLVPAKAREAERGAEARPE